MNAVYELTDEQLRAYNDDGYLVIRGVFSEQEVRVIQDECDRFLAETELLNPYNLRVGYRHLAGKNIIERLDPVRDISEVFANLVKDEKIIAPLRSIYGEEPVLFKDKLIYKLPGVSGYSMHQDASWWHGFPIESLISVMVAIDGASAENGGLELFPGYHDRLRSTPGELRNMNSEEISEIDPSTGNIVETRKGDIIIFHSFTPHQSGPNTASVSRRQLYLTYNAAQYGDLYAAHYEHYHRYTLAGKPAEERVKYYFS